MKSFTVSTRVTWTAKKREHYSGDHLQCVHNKPWVEGLGPVVSRLLLEALNVDRGGVALCEVFEPWTSPLQPACTSYVTTCI